MLLRFLVSNFLGFELFFKRRNFGSPHEDGLISINDFVYVGL